MLQYLVVLAPFVPLLQTLVWVALAIALMVWFNGPLRAILSALRHRIETGSAVKAGWFELPEFKPQPPEQQRKRAQLDVAEANIGMLSTPSTSGQAPNVVASSQFLLVEDLALRALQSDLGVLLNRQISVGPDAGFDAAFARDGTLNVVEVKFFPGSVTPAKLKVSLERIAAALGRVHWQNVRVILVLVYRRSDDMAANEDRVRRAIEGFALPIEVRTFSLPELRSRFGIGDSDA